MTLLAPLGLLGLLGVLALIIIYIIKPNYQQKFISSTYVWKLSLKYRKKRIPTSKLRNLLLILCQVLFLVTCAAILAQPNLVIGTAVKEPEVIIIVDSSASMRANVEGETRFMRAVDKAQDLILDTFEDDGYVSVIIADETPSYLLSERMRKEKQTDIDLLWSELTEETTQCSYASSDIDGAIALCESVIRENPKAKIYLYTDTVYAYVPKTVTLVNVSDEAEWNGAILSAEAKNEGNNYTFYVEVACYGGIDQVMNVTLDLNNVNVADNNEIGDNVTFEKSVRCIGEETVKMIFISQALYEEDEEYYAAYGDNIYLIPNEQRIFSYKRMHLSLQNEAGGALGDSFLEDNTFDVYGGMKQVLRIQYASALPNSFWPAVLRQIRKVYQDRWDVQITEVKKGQRPSLSGFDLYIFEHELPQILPEDGVLWLANPDKAVPSMGIRLFGQDVSSNPLGEPLTQDVDTHPILKDVDAEDITVSMFTRLVLDGSFETLLSCAGQPMLAVKNEESCKVVVMPFSLHYSNLPVVLEFPFLVNNVFEYFFPITVRGNAFEVNEKVKLNSMGQKLEVKGIDYEETFESFPAEFVVSTPGTYTIKQTTFYGKEITESIYVRVPKAESDIFQEKDRIAEPYVKEDAGDFFEDLLLYFAIGLTAVAFIEWWLRQHEGA